MKFYSAVIRPLLFRCDAESAHHWTIEACRFMGATPGLPRLAEAFFDYRDPMLHCEVAGLRFTNPLGLAAGWDKSGRALRMVESLGFGFAEIGSVSARPSQGNAKPRLFRLPTDRSIVVNYGLPNDGAEVVARRLAAHQPQRPIGVNLVKTNDGPDAKPASDEQILADYVHSATRCHRHASYLSLNLSCPNAAGGEFFGRPGAIRQLLQELSLLAIECPVFLKVAPRDDPVECDRLVRETADFEFVRGFCFNLPIGKPDTLVLTTPPDYLAGLPGAVAGKPVEALINRCIATLWARMDHQRHVIVGAGGVFSAEDAYRKIRLGASLVQLYTALIYEGPTIARQICRGLVELLRRDGFGNVTDAVGADHCR